MWVLLILGMSLLWFRPERAFADITQTISTTRQTIDLDSGSFSTGVQGLGNGLSGTVTGARIYADGTNSGGFSELQVKLYSSTDATITAADTLVVAGTIPAISASKTLYQVNWATTTLSSSLYYGLVVFCSNGCGGREDRVYGSTSNVYSAGAWTQTSSNLLDIYFEILGTITDTPSDTSTRFISFTPTLGVSTPNATSSAFSFGVTGYINDDDETDGQYMYMRWRNVSHGQWGAAGGCSAANSWGEFEFSMSSTTNAFNLSTTTSIQCYGAYGIVWQLKRPAWSLFGLTLWDETVIEAVSTFVVGTTTGGYVPSTEQIGMVDDILSSGIAYEGYIPSDANASSTMFNLYQYLDLREQVASRFPISWGIYTVNAIMLAAQHEGTTTLSSSTIDFGSMTTLQWYATSSADELEVDVWTWAWMEDLADNSAWQLLITITIGLMWLGLGLFAWREAQRVFQQATN